MLWLARNGRHITTPDRDRRSGRRIMPAASPCLGMKGLDHDTHRHRQAASAPYRADVRVEARAGSVRRRPHQDPKPPWRAPDREETGTSARNGFQMAAGWTGAGLARPRRRLKALEEGNRGQRP